MRVMTLPVERVVTPCATAVSHFMSHALRVRAKRSLEAISAKTNNICREKPRGLSCNPVRVSSV